MGLSCPYINDRGVAVCRMSHMDISLLLVEEARVNSFSLDQAIVFTTFLSMYRLVVSRDSFLLSVLPPLEDPFRWALLIVTIGLLEDRTSHMCIAECVRVERIELLMQLNSTPMDELLLFFKEKYCVNLREKGEKEMRRGRGTVST